MKNYISLKLNDLQKKGMVKLVIDEITEIIKEYNTRDYYVKMEAADKEVEYLKKYEEYGKDDVSKRKLSLTSTMAEIVASSGRRSTVTPRPIMLIEKNEEMTDEEIESRQEHLDIKLRKESKYDQLTYHGYRYGCSHGAAIINVNFEGDTVEWIPRDESYKLSDKENYKKRYSSDLLDTNSTAFKGLKRLENGETVKFKDVEKRVIKGSNKPYRVDFKKFFARLGEKDLNKHRVIGEELDYTWSDIEKRAAQNYFDKDAVEEIKSKHKDDYFKINYKIIRAIVYANLKEELVDDGEGLQDKLMRYVVYFDDDTETILKALYYPYEHNKVYYEIYNALPKDDSWLGYSFTEKNKDMEEISESFLNSLINEFNMAHMRTVLCDDPSFKPNRKVLVSGDINVLRFAKGSNMTPMKFDYASLDRVSLLNWANNTAAVQTGVDPMLASGAQTPDDPGAPARKVAIKKTSSMERIADIIINLQKSDAVIARQIESNCFQYYSNDEGEYSYFNGEKNITLSKDILKKDVTFVCHGSRLSFSKQEDQQIAMQTTQYIAQFYPEVFQDPETRQVLLKTYLQNAGGTIEQDKEEILKPLSRIVDSKNEIKQRIQQMKAKGISEKEIEIILQAEAQGQGQPQGQPQGGIPNVGA